MLPVSICLTTYNRASVLPATLDSILAQTYSDFELIVSDDCSPDHTEAIVCEYASRDSRIKYFRNHTNLKMPGNLNAAIRRAQGAYIANLHDGDVVRPDLIEKWKVALDEVPEANFVFNAYESVLSDGTRSLYREPFGLRTPGEEIARHYFRTISCCVWGTVMARATAYATHGLFDASFGFISDVDMWLRLARKATVAYIAEPLLSLSSHEVSHPYAFASFEMLLWRFAIYAKHAPAYPDCLPSNAHDFYCSEFRRQNIHHLLSVVKHRRWDRVREFLSVWRDAHDPVLRTIGRGLGTTAWQPAGYDKKCWEKLRWPEPSTWRDARILADHCR
jgi:glycosyltransferase involved in cell wall biosynthesis